MKNTNIWNLIRLAKYSPKIENKLTQTGVYWEVIDDTLYIAFRETQDTFGKTFSKETLRTILDWIYNFASCKTKGFHTGFLIKALSVYRPVRRIIAKEKYSKIYLVGFSQGGAIANIMYDFFLKRKIIKTDSESIVFGSPRPFTWFYRIHPLVVKKTIRVVNGSDIVTRVPPFLMGFKHVPCHIVHLNEKPLITKWIPSFKDHSPSHYRKLLV